jgi:TadE-like protein
MHAVIPAPVLWAVPQRPCARSTPALRTRPPGPGAGSAPALSVRPPGPSVGSSAAGSATVELAAAIPLLVAVTLAMVGVIGLARDQVLAQGAAREGAREAALGGDPVRVTAAARAALPPGRAARVMISPAGSNRVRVSIELTVRLPFRAPSTVVRATAVAARELGPASVPASS